MNAPSAGARPAITLVHGKVELALHHLRNGVGSGDEAVWPLLLLHGLGERTPEMVPGPAAAWPGPVWGLDFTGHGSSTVPRGGGYTSEILMADADAALAELGPVTVAGRGLGAYVGLMLAGARPTEVRGVVLADGPGLAGGGTSPGSPSVVLPTDAAPSPPDPLALAELARDVRPPDYALSYVRQTVQLSGLDRPVAVAAVVRPPWLEAVVDEPGVAVLAVAKALAGFSRV